MYSSHPSTYLQLSMRKLTYTHGNECTYVALVHIERPMRPILLSLFYFFPFPCSLSNNVLVLLVDVR